MRARYDGQTEWYEAFASSELFDDARRAAVRLLGDGPGSCLDLGCGTGRAIPLLVEAGWSVTAVDVSADQLAVAEQHAGAIVEHLVCADAHRLPFDDASFDAVISILTHTDLDDPGAAFAEARRVLRPGGRFVYLGVHPCFGAPAVERRAGEPACCIPNTAAPAGRRSRGTSRLRVSGHASASIICRSLPSSTRCSTAGSCSRSSTGRKSTPPLFLAVRASA